MPNPKDFLKSLSRDKISSTDRLVALLWYFSLENPTFSMPPSELCKEIESAGYGKQNVSRAKSQLKKDRRTVKFGASGYRISIKARDQLRTDYSKFLKVIPAKQTDSVFPEEIFKKARGYTIKVVRQLNASYHYGLFDCTAVMCRRLLETLIIESYEHAGKEASIKGPDGNFLMFSGLIACAENDSVIALSRNGLKGLKSFKTLGDLSAHNRRFNARKNDIDRIRDGLRVACEELLHLAGQI